jgi:hypothetical protein
MTSPTPTTSSTEIINGNATSVSNSLLGSPYEYWKNIKSPDELGISDEGSLSTLGNDIKGLISYGEVLATGTSNASKAKDGGPLGNKFFLQTGAKCKDIHSCDGKPDGCELSEVDRFIYFNNIPQGNIPFLSSGIGQNFSNARGLIPGALGNLNALNPFAMLQAFTAGSTPDCQKIMLEVVSNNNASTYDAHYITTIDLQNMDPCNFGAHGTNPVTGKSCHQGFTNKNTNTLTPAEIKLPNDPLIQLYFIGLAIIGLFILFKLMKLKNLPTFRM